MKKHPDYRVCLDKEGNVYSSLTGKKLKPTLTEFGYLKVVVVEESTGKWVTRKVHRLVSEVFIDNPLNKREVNHIDGIKTNNSVENLEWVSSRENKQHAWDMGLYTCVGENHPNAEYSEEDIREICQMLQDGFRQVDIVRLKGVKKGLVTDLNTGRRWASISKDYNFDIKKIERKSPETVLTIASMLEDKMSCKDVSEKLGIPITEIQRIKNRKTHSKLTEQFKF